MIDKPFDQIAIEDLQRLVTNGVSESRSLDYKQTLPGDAGDERRDFLADVSSFANGTGGHLVYGVSEVRENGRPTGVPETIAGLAGANRDAETLRLENMLRDGIEPRLPGVRLRWVPGFPEGPALVIRVPRSWSGPHMVTFRQHSRFYARNEAGKFALDVFQLREAFLGSGSLRERAREFRAERLGHLLAGDTPKALNGTTLVCVHVIPHASLAGAVDVDLGLARADDQNVRPIYCDFSNGTFNLDGFVTYRQIGERVNLAYLQVFRNGVIETVTGSMVVLRDSNQLLPSLAFAEALSDFIDRARRLMKILAVDAPASIFVSFLDVRGTTLAIGERLSFYHGFEATPFDRDNLLFRDVLLSEWDNGDTRAILKPLLDEVWQAAGLTRCLQYDEKGNWAPPR